MKSFFIPPWRSIAMSSMESAPATIPATSASTFSPALAPNDFGTVSSSSARSFRPVDPASIIAGTSPADDTRLPSSKVADRAEFLWKSYIYEMPPESVE